MDVCGNQTFVVAVANHTVFRLVNEANKFLGVKGRDFEILRELSSKMRFQYVLVTPHDQKWGDCDDQGLCNGMIGMVPRNEADLAISQISYSPSRAKYVNFSYPYFHDEVTFITKKIDYYEEVNLFFAEPFERQGWIFLAFLLVVFLSVIKILEYFELLRTKMFCVKTMLAIIFRQGVNLQRHMDNLSVIVTLLMFVITAGCTCKLYESVLTSSTSLTPVTPPIDTISDMVNAIRYRDYVVSPTQGSAYYRVIMTSEIEYLKIFYQSTLKRTFEVPKTAEETTSLMLNEKYALIISRNTMKHIIVQLNLIQGSFHYAKETLFIEHLVVAISKLFPCKNELNKWLKILVASGLIDKWNTEDTTLFKQSVTRTKVASANSYIAMSDLKLIFGALISGYLAGLVSLLMEIMIKYYSTHLPIGSI